jgi:two-component system, sporulation sensor kinase A
MINQPFKDRRADKNRRSTRSFRRLSDSKYRILTEASYVGVFLWQERIAYVNPYLEELLGYSKEELMQIQPEDILWPHPGQTSLEYINQCTQAIISGGLFQLKLRRKCGSPLEVEGLGTLTCYQGKQAITGTLISKDRQLFRDINRKYRFLAKLLPEPTIVHSNGIMIFANDAAINQLGNGQKHALFGKSLIERIHPEDRSRFRRMTERIYHSAGSVVPLCSEVRVDTVGGGFIYTEIRSVLVNNYMDMPVIQTTLRDITERKQAEALLIQSEKLSVVGQLAAGIAHEIRNPLTSLKGFTQLLRGKYPTDSEYFDIMLSELDRINNIVSELMAVAKPQAVQYQPMNVTGIMLSVIQLLESEAILNNVSIQLDSSEFPRPYVHCDENQLKQVFINIVKNAMEAMPEGGNIRMSLTKHQESSLLVRIVDEGMGIAPDHMSKLGNPFFTTKPHGNGLGLMICYKMIEDHHGILSIDSQPGTGTTVDIKLPLAQMEGEQV